MISGESVRLANCRGMGSYTSSIHTEEYFSGWDGVTTPRSSFCCIILFILEMMQNSPLPSNFQYWLISIASKIVDWAGLYVAEISGRNWHVRNHQKSSYLHVNKPTFCPLFAQFSPLMAPIRTRKSRARHFTPPLELSIDFSFFFGKPSSFCLCLLRLFF